MTPNPREGRFTLFPLTTMNKTLIALGCVVLLLLTGCVFGDPTAVRSVSLNFQVPEGQSKVSLSVSDTQVQEALKLIDGVLVSRGFHRDLHPLAAEDQARGIIAFYGICGVSLRENRLTVGFLEFHAQRSSVHVRKTCNLLKDKLSSRYGADRVKIEH